MKRAGSSRIALCTVAPDGGACCSFSEGAYAHDSGLRAAIADAELCATRSVPYYCGCVRRNVGVGVMIFAIEPCGVDRVLGVTRYEPTAEDRRREQEERDARSARTRILIASIGVFESGRRLEQIGGAS